MRSLLPRLITNLLLGAVALFAVLTATAWSTRADWITSPGLFPVAAGGLLLTLVSVDIWVSLAKAESSPTVVSQRHGLFALGLVGLVACYALLLTRWLPFDLATLFFLTLTAATLMQRLPSCGLILGFTGFSFVLPLLFHFGLALPIPGKSALGVTALTLLGR